MYRINLGDVANNQVPVGIFNYAFRILDLYVRTQYKSEYDWTSFQTSFLQLELKRVYTCSVYGLRVYKKQTALRLDLSYVRSST